MKIYEQFGSKVRELRKKKGVSQEDFAALIGRDARTIVAIETGKRNPTLYTIYKIAKALGVKTHELITF